MAFEARFLLTNVTLATRCTLLDYDSLGDATRWAGFFHLIHKL